MAVRVEDEATFLMQVAERLRGVVARTLVAQQAYDDLADQLTMLAMNGHLDADGVTAPATLMPDLAQAVPEPAR